MRPPPPTRYGRMPPPRVPPIGTPTMTLPITSITLLLPNWPDGPKKLGFHPKSTSPPTTPPAPMAPPLTPNVPRPSWMLLPNPEPTHGMKNPSARRHGREHDGGGSAQHELFDVVLHCCSLPLQGAR